MSEADKGLTSSTSSLPEAFSYLTTGFNSTAKVLEMMCRIPAVTNSDGPTGTDGQNVKPVASQGLKKLNKLAVVFVCRSDLPAALYSPLPFLVTCASQALPEWEKVRLVVLPKNSRFQLSKAMGLPKVGIIGLANGPSTSTLVNYVRQNVRPQHASHSVCFLSR